MSAFRIHFFCNWNTNFFFIPWIWNRIIKNSQAATFSNSVAWPVGPTWNQLWSILLLCTHYLYELPLNLYCYQSKTRKKMAVSLILMQNHIHCCIDHTKMTKCAFCLRAVFCLNLSPLTCLRWSNAPHYCTILVDGSFHPSFFMIG